METAIQAQELILFGHVGAGKAFANIDVANRVIRSVILAQVGEAKGHGVFVEKSFLETMVKFTDARQSEIKCNFNHNWDDMGKQLGMVKNIKLSGNKVIGDLHLYKAADLSPTNPNMATWLLTQAQENPSVVNCSIKFVPEYYYEYDADKAKVKVDRYQVWNNLYSGGTKKYYVAFKALNSCDLVESGALTETLFSKKTSNTMSLWKKLFGLNEAPAAPSAEVQLAEATTALEEGVVFAQGLQTQLEAANARIVELEKLPGAIHTSGETSIPGASEEFKSAFDEYFAAKQGK
ncbi:MAG: hypothetical protein ABI002_11225 [Saprospiraceae bacterium]